MRSEVDKDAQPETGCVQVVEDLRFVFGNQLVNGLYLDHDFVKTDEVRLEGLLQDALSIREFQFPLSYEGNVPIFQFNLQTFLINRL